MESQAAKCPECGVDIKVQSDRDTVRCRHCGKDIIVRQVVATVSGPPLESRRNRPKRTTREPVDVSVPVDPIDRLIATDPVLITLGTKIRKHQRLLREACSADAWRIYLQIEELTNERCFAIVDKASAVARDQARRGRSATIAPAGRQE